MILFDDARVSARIFVTESESYKYWNGLASMMPILPVDSGVDIPCWIVKDNPFDYIKALRAIGKINSYEQIGIVGGLPVNEVITMLTRCEMLSIVPFSLNFASASLWSPSPFHSGLGQQIESFGTELEFEKWDSVEDVFQDFIDDLEHGDKINFVLVGQPDLLRQIGKIKSDRIRMVEDSHVPIREVASNGEFKSEIYLIPFESDFYDGQKTEPLLYFGYKDFRTGELGEGEFWTDEGKFLWKMSQNYLDYKVSLSLHWFCYARPDIAFMPVTVKDR